MMIFLDLDGTLLNSQKEVSAGNRKALQAAREQGHQVVLCSGRPLSAMKQIIKELDLQKPGCFVISYNGALIYDCHKEEVIFSAPLTKREVDFLFAEADKELLYVQTYDTNYLLTRRDCPEVRYYAGLTDIQVKLLPTLPQGMEELPYKVLFIDLKDHARLLQFKEKIELQEQEAGHLNGFFSCPQFLEFVREGISKGSAIRWLSQYLGVPLNQTVGVGDSDNDIPMLETAGISVAMQNADAEIKAHAGYVTEHDCDHDGVAEVIERFVL